MSLIHNRFVTNADLRNGHAGLAELALENNLNIPKMRKKDMVIFLNGDFTALKIALSPTQVLHFKPDHTMTLDEVLQQIAHALNQSFDFVKRTLGKDVEKIIYKEYTFLKARHENIAKRQATSVTKKAKKSTRTSSKK